MLLPVEALISMPLWFEDAPAVGDLRFPYPDVMRPLAGHGQRSEELPVEVVVVLPVFPFAVELFVFPAAAAFLAASSAAFFRRLFRFLLLNLRLHLHDLGFLRLDIVLIRLRLR